MKQSKRFWQVTKLIRGTETLVAEIPTTHITEDRLLTLMKTVFAKHTMTDEEIVGCHLRANVKRYRDLFHIEKYTSADPISIMLSDGSNWVHAIVVRPEDKRVADR